MRQLPRGKPKPRGWANILHMFRENNNCHHAEYEGQILKLTRQTHGGGVHLGTFKCTVQNNIKRQTLRWGWQTAGLEQQPTVKQRTGSSANKDGSAKAHFWQPDYIFVHLRINYLCCCLRGKALICAFVWYLMCRRKNAWQLPIG